ncbi:hypothetical protein METBIDRAFT_220095 [Metschnikowia bicuspidata var. bicuspidata NRRL YB-4993]|uniref:Uncharacterized protein n=1 Tax=Metschnikowia bicuspidata var. bicuspidata NRRL YB-4993 TaxID=869754 RepID=A0A1A0H545_9ASCO|nr:hypothetical protein METBIDRAFT_220095 [Metschnikowia bicuspidata var. bicuspidata NRRL YB-4993]OBA19199.1 hypothetical protein METBIDRAFT_220095 [Metschnikowia bicuspidata var. bicuspidata NRRL YB-4993]
MGHTDMASICMNCIGPNIGPRRTCILSSGRAGTQIGKKQGKGTFCFVFGGSRRKSVFWKDVRKCVVCFCRKGRSIIPGPKDLPAASLYIGRCEIFAVAPNYAFIVRCELLATQAAVLLTDHVWGPSPVKSKRRPEEKVQGFWPRLRQRVKKRNEKKFAYFQKMSLLPCQVADQDPKTGLGVQAQSGNGLLVFRLTGIASFFESSS